MEPGIPGGESCTGTCHLFSQVFRAGGRTLRVVDGTWRIQRAEGETSGPVGDSDDYPCPGAASAAVSANVSADEAPFLVECAAHGE